MLIYAHFMPKGGADREVGAAKVRGRAIFNPADIPRLRLQAPPFNPLTEEAKGLIIWVRNV